MRFLRIQIDPTRPRPRPWVILRWLLLVGIWLSAPAPVHAAPSGHITLELDAPDACVEQRAILDSVDARLGAAFETDTELRARARVLKLSAAVYQLDLSYRTSAGAQEERSLRGESCGAVADALAFLLSLALAPRPAPVTVPAPVAVPGEPYVTPSVAVFGALDSAVLSRLALGVGLMLGVRVGTVELVARAQLLFPRSSSENGVTTTLQAFSADLGLCRPFRWSSVALAPCARAELGQLSGKVQGTVVDDTPGAARFQALGLGGMARVRLFARLWLMVNADLTWMLRRPTFVVSELGEVGRPRQFGTRVLLGPFLTW